MIPLFHADSLSPGTVLEARRLPGFFSAGCGLLIVEDEQKAGAYIRKGVEEAGYSVDAVNDGAEGLILATEENYDVIVLDVMLPTMDGWTVIKILRESKSASVLFLTARDDVDDRVRGFELGGDDYLVKPFAFVELLARVRALARRGPARETDLISVADFGIDVTRRKVRRAGKRIAPAR